MPYIGKQSRILIDSGKEPTTAGELNYVITKEVLRYLGPTPGYTAFNDVLGVLTAVGLELNRRLLASYEDRKIAENGDVYPHA